MTREEWLNHELESMGRWGFIALLCDFAETCASEERLADYVDNWFRHS